MKSFFSFCLFSLLSSQAFANRNDLTTGTWNRTSSITSGYSTFNVIENTQFVPATATAPAQIVSKVVCFRSLGSELIEINGQVPVEITDTTIAIKGTFKKVEKSGNDECTLKFEPRETTYQINGNTLTWTHAGVWKTETGTYQRK